MAEERRKVRRVRVTDVKATYESATGERLHADVFDLGKGGLFLKASRPLPMGKRLSLEIKVAGESSTWSALGRIVWTRLVSAGPERPAGMGVKLIDVEDAVLDAIERLVEARAATDRGITPSASPPPRPRTAAPVRERTVLGLGLSAGAIPRSKSPMPRPVAPVPSMPVASPAAAPIAATPIIPIGSPAPHAPQPPRAATDGNGPDESLGEREASVPIELVSMKSSSRPPAAAMPVREQAAPRVQPPPEDSFSPREIEPPAQLAQLAQEEARPAEALSEREPEGAEEDEEELRLPKKGSGGWLWLLLLVLLVAAAAYGYLHRDRVLALWIQWRPRR
jgi:Tfp pilus assembly protein PilZ